MTRLRVGLLIGLGVFLLAIIGAGAAYYVRIYRPIQSPLTAIFGAKTLETRLQNRTDFLPPPSGELTDEQAAKFMAIEEAVQKQLGAGAEALAQNQADLERANADGTLSVRTTFLAFGNVKVIYLRAKAAQVDALNRANFSKQECEWIRRQLYSAAGLRLSQVDMSDVLDGVHDAVVRIRQFEPETSAPEVNTQLARPVASKLQGWLALGFFGL